MPRNNNKNAAKCASSDRYDQAKPVKHQSHIYKTKEEKQRQEAKKAIYQARCRAAEAAAASAVVRRCVEDIFAAVLLHAMAEEAAAEAYSSDVPQEEDIAVGEEVMMMGEEAERGGVEMMGSVMAAEQGLVAMEIASPGGWLERVKSSCYRAVDVVVK
jgi:hypothetical protein